MMYHAIDPPKRRAPSARINQNSLQNHASLPTPPSFTPANRLKVVNWLLDVGAQNIFLRICVQEAAAMFDLNLKKSRVTKQNAQNRAALCLMLSGKNRQIWSPSLKLGMRLGDFSEQEDYADEQIQMQEFLLKNDFECLTYFEVYNQFTFIWDQVLKGADPQLYKNLSFRNATQEAFANYLDLADFFDLCLMKKQCESKRMREVVAGGMLLVLLVSSGEIRRQQIYSQFVQRKGSRLIKDSFSFKNQFLAFLGKLNINFKQILHFLGCYADLWSCQPEYDETSQINLKQLLNQKKIGPAEMYTIQTYERSLQGIVLNTIN